MEKPELIDVHEDPRIKPPEDALIEMLEAGDRALLLYVVNHEPEYVWAVLTNVFAERTGFEGYFEVDNPSAIPGVKDGDRVAFGRRHIVEVRLEHN